MSTCLRSRFRKREREKKIEGRRKGVVDTVKSKAYRVCARTSTKPPKGRRRRNSQSRSSVPCCVMREKKMSSSKLESLIRFSFVSTKIPFGEKLFYLFLKSSLYAHYCLPRKVLVRKSKLKFFEWWMETR